MNVREQQQNPPAPSWLAVVKSHVEKTRFGAVQVIIHDGRIVRVERTEKVLFEPATADQTSGGQTHPQRTDQLHGGSRI